MYLSRKARSASMLPDAQVLRPPRHRLTQLDQPGRPAADRHLTRRTRGDHVEIDAPREIEHPLHGGANHRAELDEGHADAALVSTRAIS